MESAIKERERKQEILAREFSALKNPKTRRNRALTCRDHRMVGYRVPKERAALTEGQRGAGSLAAFKRGSRSGFLAGYGSFVCGVRDCGVCASVG